MSFQPVIPMGGLSGWAFLERTRDSQAAAFENGAVIRRDTAYFEARIAGVETAEQLVSDRRLLRVALGAFGLQDDLDNRYFIRRILEDGTARGDALAMRLTDSRYRAFADAFGFGNPGGRQTNRTGFGAQITSQFRARQFEIAVGEQDQGLRLAMTARRELPGIAGAPGSDTTKWLKIMGNPPLRQFFETALGLPKGIGKVDLDKQIEFFDTRARSQLQVDGPGAFGDRATMDKLVQRYLLREQIDGFAAQSGSSVALSLLQSARMRA